jgi:uncharacterized protein
VKPSFYNYVTTLSDGTTLFFNFYTLALVALDASEAKVAQGLLADPTQSPTKKAAAELKRLLADKGFLIDKRVNELDLLRRDHFASRVRQGHLSLTIALTFLCNFNCEYCYQEKTQERMTPEVEEALISFVRDRVVKGGGLSVTWYGGEPLLCVDIIERLSKAFMAICEEVKAEYSAGIITNAYLLDKETAEKLVSWKVTNAQITLDGPPQVHDARRPLRSGGKTFQRILDNIKDAPSQLFIELRMNVDDKNRGHIMELLEILEGEGLQGRMAFYLGQTYPYTDVCRDVSSWCLSEEDFSLLGLETGMELVQRGFNPTGIPASKNYSCMADKENAVAVTPSGGLVKCWNEVTKPGAEVGHLLKPRTAQMQENIERWRRRDPFELECTECLLLPICMGGCPYLYERTGTIDCHPWKYHLKESLCFYYYVHKLKQESEIVQEFRELVEYAKETA